MCGNAVCVHDVLCDGVVFNFVAGFADGRTFGNRCGGTPDQFGTGLLEDV